MIKVIGTASKRDDFTTEEFFRYWRDVHAPISGAAPGLRGYVVSEVLRRYHGELEVEAFVQQWWDDEESMRRGMESDAVKAAWEDVPNYAKTDGTFWVTKEHVYIPRPVLGRGSLASQAWIS